MLDTETGTKALLGVKSLVLRGVSGPSGPETAKKSQKGSFWGSGEKSQKIPGKSLKIPKKLPFWVFFRYF